MRPRSDGGHCSGDGICCGTGHKGHDLFPGIPALLQRADLIQSNGVCEHMARSSPRGIEIRMCGVQRAAVAEERCDHPSGRSGSIQGPEGAVQCGVVCNDQVCSVAGGFSGNGFGGIEGHEDPSDPRTGIADLESNVIAFPSKRAGYPGLKDASNIAHAQHRRPPQKKKNPAVGRESRSE